MGILSWASRAVPAIVVGLRYMADSGLAICVQIQCARLRLKSRVPKTRRGRSICVPGGFQSFEFFLSAFVRALTLNLSVVARYDRKGLRLFSFWGVCDNNDGGCQVSMLWCSFLVTRIDRGLSIAASYLESSPVRRLSSPLDMSSRLLITVPTGSSMVRPNKLCILFHVAQAFRHFMSLFHSKWQRYHIRTQYFKLENLSVSTPKSM